MASFLSREWLDDLAWRAATLPDGTFPASTRVVVGIEVPDAPGGPCRFAVRIGDGRVDVSAASDDFSDVVLWISTDARTASEFADGEITAQQALDRGSLRLRGPASAFLALRDVGLAGDRRIDVSLDPAADTRVGAPVEERVD